MLLIHANELYRKWSIDMIIKLDKDHQLDSLLDKRQFDNEFKQIKLPDVYEVFYFFPACTIISLFCLLVEIVC